METTIKQEIIKGLTSNPKYFSGMCLWNEEGSRLYDIKIEECKWYYFHRYELKLFQSFSELIFNHLDGFTMLIDLGSGNAIKTKLLIDHLMLKNQKMIYAPADISEEHMMKMISKMKDRYGDRLDIKPFVCDYLQALKPIRNFKEKKLFLWFGCLMNFSSKDHISTLRRLSEEMDVDDRLLITVDGTDHHNSRKIELAYLDPDGYTGRFFTNAITWINKSLSGNIDVTKFDYKNKFVPDITRESCSYVQCWLESTEKCEFTIGEKKITLKFDEGEKIYFHKDKEYSCKFTMEQLQYICEKSFLRIIDIWRNEHVIALYLQKR